MLACSSIHGTSRLFLTTRVRPHSAYASIQNRASGTSCLNNHDNVPKNKIPALAMRTATQINSTRNHSPKSTALATQSAYISSIDTLSN